MSNLSTLTSISSPTFNISDTSTPCIEDVDCTTNIPLSGGKSNVSVTALQGPKEVGEGMPYEEASFGDKYVTTVEAKKGRLLSITEEDIHFDQTGDVEPTPGPWGER